MILISQAKELWRGRFCNSPKKMQLISGKPRYEPGSLPRPPTSFYNSTEGLFALHLPPSQPWAFWSLLVGGHDVEISVVS